MIKSLGGGVITAIIIVFLIGFLIPSSYEIKKTISVQTSVEKAYQVVSKLQNWQKWAYDDAEAIANLRYEGAIAGLGAIYTWKDDYSAGRMEIIEEQELKELKAKLIINYGEQESLLTFQFEEIETGTKITWIQTGDMGYDIRARFFMLVGGLEKSIGAQNQAGLERLKLLLEK